MPSSNRKLLENLSFQSIAEFAGKGLQAIYFIYLANILGAEGMGIYGFASSIIAYFLLLVGFGIDVYGSREIAINKDNILENVNKIFSLRLTLALLSYSLLILFVVLFVEEQIVSIAILILGINIFSNAILLNWVFQGIEKMGIIAARQLMVSTLSLVLILIFVKSYDDIIIAFAILAGSLLLNSNVMSLYYLNKVGKINLHIDRKSWKKIIRYSLPIGLFTVLVSIMNNIDISLIYTLAESSKYETGIYNAAYRIVAFAIVPSLVVQNAFFPQLSRESTKENRIRILNKYSKLMNLVAGITGFITFFYSDFIIRTLLTDEYFNSIELMRLFAFSIFIVFLNVSLSSSLVAWKKEKKVFYCTVIAVTMNIIIDLILIPSYGAYGATIATIVAEFSLFLTLTYFIYKEVGKSLFNNTFAIFLIGIMSVIPSIFYINSNLGEIVGIFVSVILFVIITHFSGYFRILDIKKIINS